MALQKYSLVYWRVVACLLTSGSLIPVFSYNSIFLWVFVEEKLPWEMRKNRGLP